MSTLIQGNSRVITPRLAPIIAALELREAAIVDAIEIAHLSGLEPRSPNARSLIRRLVAARWLRPLPARGQYEFLSGRAGPFSRNDILDPLRALTRGRDTKFQVALTAAAFLRGFADRAPVDYDVLVPMGKAVSSRLRSTYRIHVVAPSRLFGATPLEGVMVSTRERLLVDAALWPQLLGRSIALSDHWLRNAIRDASSEEVVSMLKHLNSTRATARAGYLADRFGRPDMAAQIAGLGRSPVAVPLIPGGPPASQEERDARFNIVDSVGAASRS